MDAKLAIDPKASAPLVSAQMAGTRRWLTFLLVGALSGSLALNVVLFLAARAAFFGFNELRLDPLALGRYPAGDGSRAGNETRVVLYGDSRVEMWPVPATLSGSDFVLFNRGIGGQTTAQMVLRFEEHVASLRPDVVVLQAGINDLHAVALFPPRRDAIVRACLDDLRRLIAMSRRAGAKVLVTTIFGIGDVPPRWYPFWSTDIEKAIGEVNRELRALHEDGVVVVDVASVLDEREHPGSIRPEYRSGFDHLNGRGYDALDAAVTPALMGLRHAAP